MFRADELLCIELDELEVAEVNVFDPDELTADDKPDSEEVNPDVRLIFARRFLNQNWMFFGSNLGNFWR